MKTQERPELSKKLTVDEFKKFYWEKKELIAFCRDHKIPTQGGKIDLENRIIYYLETGKIKTIKKIVRLGDWDSSKNIIKQTPVINFKCDALTRKFFTSERGDKFKFNQYLREFAKQPNDGTITYGDLVDGWKVSQIKKKKIIDKQFQYNQFQRDFYAHDKNETRSECLKAWRLVRSVEGEATYKHYLTLKNDSK